VSWNSVIRRYVGKGRFFEATDLFRRMKEETTKPSELLIASLTGNIILKNQMKKITFE